MAEVAVQTKMTPHPLPVVLFLTASQYSSGPNMSTAIVLKMAAGPTLFSGIGAIC